MRESYVVACVVTVFLVTTPALRSPEPPTTAQPCESAEYLGICDPYVPGTIIVMHDNQPVRVLATWPQGPAEKAGICSGDQILAVNGVSTSDNTNVRLLKEIASDSPTPIRLEVKRGTAIRELDVGRVRESTLANLSKQKIAMVGGLFGPVSYVPLDELPDEIQEFRKFQDRIAAGYGFTSVEGIYVPVGTPQEQVENVLAARQSDRMIGLTGFAPGPDAYSAGLLAMSLAKPDEVLVLTVIPDSPAHHAGSLPGDQIVAINGRSTSGLKLDEIRDLLLKPEGPRKLDVKVTRNGSLIVLNIGTRKTKELEDTNLDQVPPNADRSSGDNYLLGIYALHDGEPREAIVAQVQYPSPAFDAGLHVGDLLLTVNGLPIAQIDRKDLSKLLTPSGPAKVVLEVSRLNKKMSFTLTPVTYRAALASIGRKPTKFGTTPQNCPDI
jgi:C-terminal processing protease CtpA/Prc